MEWESSQSFPWVTLSLTLLQCLHGNQRLASKLRCLLNLPPPASPPSSFPQLRMSLFPFPSLSHSFSAFYSYFFFLQVLIQPAFKIIHPIKKMRRVSHCLTVVIDLFRQDQADFNGHRSFGKPKWNLPSSLASLINTLFENFGQPHQIWHFHSLGEFT